MEGESPSQRCKYSPNNSPHTPKNTAPSPITKFQIQQKRKIENNDAILSPIAMASPLTPPPQANPDFDKNYDESDSYSDFIPMSPPKTRISKPEKTCMRKRTKRDNPNSSYITEISPGVHEIIIDGLSGPLYVRLLKDSIDAYEFLFFKNGVELLGDETAVRNRLLANMQMTRNMFRKSLDLWISCILFHPQMGGAHFEILYYLKYKCMSWLTHYTHKDDPSCQRTVMKYSEDTDERGGVPTRNLKRNPWLVYVSTVIVLGIHAMFVQLCDPDVFRELLHNLADSVIEEENHFVQ